MQKKNNFGLICASPVFCLIAFLASITGCGKDDSSDPKQILAETRYGTVGGYENDGAYIWKGIPFAKPPVGTLRWKAPDDPDSWSGVRDATTSCSECTQQLTDQFWRPTADAIIGSEDCLYVDIYRPATDMTDASDQLPVCVWIHGGANRIGSAKPYNAGIVASHGNMVVAVIQYRLGSLGWMTHPALRASGSELDQSGNYGTLDQMKALAWVRDNISAFGGDPERVTIAGQSAGGHNVMNMLISPLSNNFQGAFAMSPALSALMPLRTFTQGDAQCNKIIDWLLIDDDTCANNGDAATHRAAMTDDEIVEYLRGKSAEKIVQAAVSGAGNPMPTAFMDGAVMPTTTWLDAINSGAFKRVPLVIGTTQYEFKDLMTTYGTLIKLLNIPSGEHSWDDLYDVLAGEMTFDEVLPTDLDKYTYEQAGLLKSRKWQADCNEIARAIKENDSANMVYSYLFAWAGGGDPMLEDFRKIFGGSHAQDIPFWFGSTTDLFGYSFTDANKSGREALQGAMMDYIYSFVNTGDPNQDGSTLPEWSPWSNTPGDPKFIRLDADLDQYLINMDASEATEAVVEGEITSVLDAHPDLGTLFNALGI